MNKTKSIINNALMISLLVVSSYVIIPTGHIPFTLQLIMVFIILLINNTLNAFIIFGVYLIMGTIGLPVFSGGSSGIGATYGFIIAFALIPFIKGIIQKIIKKELLKNILICMFSLITMYLLGSLFYSIYFEVNYIISLKYTVVPFIAFDILKIIIAMVISVRYKKIFL